ncbi:hypothetical protein phiPLPE_03 [Iodobacter phage PhiPLPE]|uniref:Uncharacterized protein n=1 Tax=Iodobacter phage PhiPLPE TaxID=551895 RepID=B5AX22_9CAUD|nr:hypothetical protein phiPLPE_03 [Iodobacter phage PhiPLPE]ACG60325.1 hypothetical protein phiPLPE_03 [Iodobacter phage PhiPLPE]
MLHSIKFPLELWNRINEFKEKEGRSFAGAVKRLVELGFASLEKKG